MNLKTIVTKICALIVLGTLTQCATSQKIDNKPPMQTENAYFQEWSTETNGAGFTVFISVKDPELKLQHAYFLNKKIALTKDPNKAEYSGSYTYPKKGKDLVMSSDPKEEFKNTLPAGIERIPFKLKDNECVIVYTKDGKEGHFKIDNLPKQ